MYNYYQQQQQQAKNNFVPAMSGFGLKGRPVSSLEEVRALSVDFDGSIFYFPDIANKRIYTKQINMDGTASLNMYELKPIPPETPNGDFVTRQEFEQVLRQLQATIEGMRAPAPAAQPTKEQLKPQDF